jgi:hypothetical protein
MIRLFIIALAGLLSFVVFMAVLSRFMANKDQAAWGAVLIGMVGTPLVLLRVWRGSDPSTRCPGGKGLYPECLFTVRLGDSEVSVHRPDGTVERLALDRLKEVSIVTNDCGPAGSDVWWLLVGSPTEGCAFPGGASGEQEVLRFVQQLPGFDNGRFIEAMGSTSNAKFVCWTAGDTQHSAGRRPA